MVNQICRCGRGTYSSRESDINWDANQGYEPMCNGCYKPVESCSCKPVVPEQVRCPTNIPKMLCDDCYESLDHTFCTKATRNPNCPACVPVPASPMHLCSKTRNWEIVALADCVYCMPISACKPERCHCSVPESAWQEGWDACKKAMAAEVEKQIHIANDKYKSFRKLLEVAEKDEAKCKAMSALMLTKEEAEYLLDLIKFVCHSEPYEPTCAKCKVRAKLKKQSEVSK